VTLWAGLPYGVAAQQGSDGPVTLDRVETALDSGQVEGARAALDEWFRRRAGRAPAPDRARAHLLRARLAEDPAAARREYTRVALEGGPHGARARLRLAQLDLAQGRLEQALEELGLLRADYPATPLAAESWLWTGRVQEQAERADRACSAYRRALTSARALGRPELRRAAGEALAGCGEGRGGAPPAEVAREDARFVVQLGAFSTRAAAEELRGRLAEAGVEARITDRNDGDGLYRVRAGRFRERREAEARATELEERGFRAIAVRIAASGDGP
jgi:tetratricopeptide (TPR) repeat protein